MRICRVYWGWVPICLVACSGLTMGQDTAKQLVQAQMDRHRLDTEREDLIMRVTKKSGREKERRMVRFAENDADGSMRMMAILTAPEDVRGTGVLFLQDGETGSSRQWLFLPALKLAKKISASGKKNNFMGTDFAYEDMRPLDLSAYELRLIGEEEVDGQPCHVIDAIPATEEERQDSGYAKRRFWIRKDIVFTIKTVFFDNRGEVTKVWVNEDLVQVGDTAWRANRMVMTGARKGRQTELIVEHRDTETQLDADFFTVDSLKNWGDDKQ